jgi:hypothetical protein
MNIVDVLLIIFILILAVISSGSKMPSFPKRKTEEEKDVARLRQMQEWDRFDDTKK